MSYNQQFTLSLGSVGTGDTTSDPVVISQFAGGLLSVEADNTGANPLDKFTLQTRTHPDATFEDYISGAEWNNGTNENVFSATADLSATGATSDESADVHVRAADAIRFVVSADGGATVLTIRGTLRRT